MVSYQCQKQSQKKKLATILSFLDMYSHKIFFTTSITWCDKSSLLRTASSDELI